MFEWMNRHKQNIMKYTLYLVIPSFVLLYGYGECAKPESHQWVAKVNGETITEFAFNQWVDTIQNQIKRMGQGTDLTYDEIRQQALEMAILTTIYEQKAEEWGIATTDEELLSNIQQIPAFQNENGVFDANRYRGLLAANQIHPLQFEQEQRENLTRTKVQSVIRNSVFRSATDKEQFNARQNNKALVEFLSFEPAAFTEQVEPATDAMMAFFEENKEDYRVAEKRKIGYVRFFPSEYVKDVSPTEREVERFFEQNQQKYEIPEQVRVDYITYSSDAFKDQV
ncbi:MAG: SurA N-terminal domain-containing protein, partial [bacterium]|nr:SurA N-terminal domain-containing protein [bacterium]